MHGKDLSSKVGDGSTDGTFHFCATCPSNNCCVKTQTLGHVDPPFVFDREAKVIAAALSANHEIFSDGCTSRFGEQVLHLKASNNSCIFYKDGMCKIYRHRPFDCRIFPFDIIQYPDGRLFWIVFVELCPVKVEYEKYFDSTKRMLKEINLSREEATNFAQYAAETMGKHKYEVLEEVHFSC